MNWKYVVLPLLAVGGIVAAAVTVSKQSKPPPAPPPLVPPSGSPFAGRVSGSGIVEPSSELILLGAQHRHLQPVGVIETVRGGGVSPGDPKVIQQALAHGLHDPVGQWLASVCRVTDGLVKRIDSAGGQRHAHGAPVVVEIDIGKPHSPRYEAECRR